MPRRRAASGDLSPSPQETINVAMPRNNRPRARLKLKLPLKKSEVDQQSEPEPEQQPSYSRPKRSIKRPARYSDRIVASPRKRRKLSTVSTGYSQESDHLLHTPAAFDTIASDSVIMPMMSSHSINKIDTMNVQDEQSAGYSANFLTNFIEDTPRSCESASDSVLGSAHRPKVQVDLLPQSDALQESVSLVYDTPSHPPSGTATFYHVADSQSPILLSSDASMESRQLGQPDTKTDKLQVAYHALSKLNIPSIPKPREVVSPLTYKRSSDVDILLAAAAGSDPIKGSDPIESSKFNEPCLGEPDADLLLLIRYAVEMLNNHIVTKVHLAERAGTASDKGRKRNTKGSPGQYSTDKERSAKLALEHLLNDGAISINCIISKERAHYIWHLYMQLLYLVTTPHLALPDAIQFLRPDHGMALVQQRPFSLASSSFRQEHPFSAMTLPPQKAISNHVPEPHQFNRRHGKAS